MQMADNFIEKMKYPRMKTQVGLSIKNTWCTVDVNLIKVLFKSVMWKSESGPSKSVAVLQVEILPQGRETIIFKQFFKNWN